MREFKFEQTYEEIKVAGKVYRIDFSDDKLKEYQKECRKYYNEVLALEKKDDDKMTDEERLEYFEDMKKLVQNVIDTLLGKGAFDELYEASGRSLMNIYDFVDYLYGVVKERSERNREDKRKKYVKKKK